YAAALLRPRLLPPHPRGVDDREREADLLARHVGAVDGGSPFAVDVRFCSHSHTDIMPDSATEISRHSATGLPVPAIDRAYRSHLATESCVPGSAPILVV